MADPALIADVQGDPWGISLLRDFSLDRDLPQIEGC